MKAKPLTHDQKHRLSYSHYIENIPINELSIRYDISEFIIRQFLSDVINDEGLMRAFLPSEYFRSLKETNFLGKFSGYYDWIHDEITIGNEPDYTTDKHLILSEGQSLPYIVTYRESFSERLSKMKLMVNELLETKVLN